MTLIVINVAIFYFEYTKFGTALIQGIVNSHQMLEIGGDMGSITWHGQFWRAISAMFIHASPSHIINNMVSLLCVGPILETRCKNLRYLIIYFFSGVFGSFLNGLVNPNTVTVGASGAIFGVLGALFILTLIRNKSFTNRASFWVLLIILINLATAIVDPQISLISHIGGVVMGASLMGLFLYTDAISKKVAYNKELKETEKEIRLRK